MLWFFSQQKTIFVVWNKAYIHVISEKLAMVSRDTIVVSAVSATIGFLTCHLMISVKNKPIDNVNLLTFSGTDTPNSDEENKPKPDQSKSPGPSMHCDQGDNLLNLLSRCRLVK